jgi:hypothetical protein
MTTWEAKTGRLQLEVSPTKMLIRSYLKEQELLKTQINGKTSHDNGLEYIIAIFKMAIHTEMIYRTNTLPIKIILRGKEWWCTPVLPTIQQAEFERIAV